MGEKNNQGQILPLDTLPEEVYRTTPRVQDNSASNVHLKQRLGASTKLIAPLLVAYLLISCLQRHYPRLQSNLLARRPEDICKQEQPLRPSSNVAGKITHALKSDGFAVRAAEALGGAVRVNTYGLLYEWKGSDDSLAPLLLMAHQGEKPRSHDCSFGLPADIADVVPVDPAAYSFWKEPPYSGKLVDGYIWGRGSVDFKSGLIGILLAVEALLEEGWTPKRTITLSFGFDEETSGLQVKALGERPAFFVNNKYIQGASYLSKYLEEKQKKKFSMIVDEGGAYNTAFGRMTAAPAIAEKGYMDIRIKVNTPGGHSSIPPTHTSIGYLALLLAQLEANPRPIQLTRQSPIFKSIECSAIHSPDIPDRLRRQVIRASKGDEAALKEVTHYIINSDGPKAAWLRSILSTTQAVDMIHGGVKSNALPEEVFAIVNHRVAIDSSLEALKDSVVSLLSPVASKHNLELVGFDNTSVSSTSGSFGGKVTLSDAWGDALEPAPISPTDSAAYKLLSGTIRAAWEDAHPTEESIIVVPSMMGGNTDTRWYWGLSDNIFRYSHVGEYHFYNGMHTVNEAIRLDGFVDMVKFFSVLILNADESKTI
ncbi:hypothetical protein FRC00_005274 [Tulasnella sp. 408]|nr:hypothetical protein FRC00_005274 [Tulasnella sp. 408]